MRLPTKRLTRTLLPTLVLSSLFGLLLTPLLLSRHDASSPSPVSTPAPVEGVREAYGRIPLSFEANRGQADASVNFLARGAGYALFLKPTEAVFLLRGAEVGSRDGDAAERSLTT